MNNSLVHPACRELADYFLPVGAEEITREEMARRIQGVVLDYLREFWFGELTTSKPGMPISSPQAAFRA